MTKWVRALLLVLYVLGAVDSARASHIYGGELLYRHISGNTYRITLTIYGDCSATGVFSTLDTSATRPVVFVYNGTSLFRDINLELEGRGVEVSPVCPKLVDSTSCKGGKLPGVTRFIFSDTITLPSSSSQWQFIFAGQLVTSMAGRSQNITNVRDASSSYTYLSATLNNILGPNSSPQYSTIPTPFYCTNVAQQYNQGAIDADGDSLAFTLVPAVAGVPNLPLLSDPVGYYAPYTATAPLATTAGTFSFNELNGQMNFTPNGMQNALVVNRVSEYRNGVLIGTSEREMTFIVSDNCSSNPPELRVANLVSGNLTTGNVINICIGTPRVKFDILLSNPDGDTTEITAKNIPGNALLNINANNTPMPTMSFDWVTDTLAAGVYTFFLDVKNNHCPIASRQTIAYTINVVPFPTVGVTELWPTACIHKAAIRYDLALGYLPRTLTVSSGGSTVASYLDSTGIVIDSLAPGTYNVTVASNSLCATSATFNVVDSGVLPLVPFSVEYCQGQAANKLSLQPYGPTASISWFNSARAVLPEAPVPPTDEWGDFTYYVQQVYKVCTSALTPVTVNVWALPDVRIKVRTGPICYGDTIMLSATGGDTYTWTPADRLGTTADGQLYIRMLTKALIGVTATTTKGCIDSTSLLLQDIQQCCQFTYPTAFTPNGDGKNDYFRIAPYGNLFSYKLAIYNRFGQMVHLSYSPWQPWDGTFNGQPCDIGTYYYYFEGRCLTGGTDQRKGDVTLIR
jgi:gliding motility-associated-like protein